MAQLYTENISNDTDSIDQAEEILERALAQFLSEKELEEDLLCEEIVEPTEEFQTLFKRQKILLCWNLLVDLKGKGKASQEKRRKLWQLHKNHHLSKSFQLSQALNALNADFLGMEFEPFSPKLFSSGAAPLEVEGLFPEAALPFPKLHAELGVIWAILGERLKEKKLSVAAKKVAEWQKNNLLDHHFYPSVGTFTEEKEGSLVEQVIANRLLFYSVALLSQEGGMLELANKQEKIAEKLILETPSRGISSFATILLLWLDKNFEPSLPSAVQLPRQFCDLNLSLLGRRTDDSHLLCVATGRRSGLGSYAFGDLKIVNYGPQFLPLGDCENFGIENHCFLEKQTTSNSYMETLEGGFLLKSKGLALSSEKYSGAWIDLKQQLSNNCLEIELSPFCLTHPQELAFSFFLKGNFCEIGDAGRVKPDSLDRYEGAVLPVKICGNEGSLLLEHFDPKGEMQVIPLAGGESFWGAKFLLAFSLQEIPEVYKWRVTPQW